MTNKCKICNEGVLTEDLCITSHKIFGVNVFVQMKYSTCDSCGSEQADFEQTKWNKEQMMLAILQAENEKLRH